MTITVFNIGGNDYTSYATVDEADTFLNVDLARKAAWTKTSFTTEDKQVHLVYATRIVDLARPFTGEKQDAMQITEFPRNNILCNGEPVADGLPEDIEFATILNAGSIATNPALATIVQQASGPMLQVKKVDANAGSVEFFPPSQGTVQVDTSVQLTLDQEADRLIRCYVRAAGVGGRAPGAGAGSAFGISSRSSFSDPNEYYYG